MFFRDFVSAKPERLLDHFLDVSRDFHSADASRLDIPSSA
jgi:hypothetical protein